MSLLTLEASNKISTSTHSAISHSAKLMKFLLQKIEICGGGGGGNPQNKAIKIRQFDTFKVSPN